MTSPEACTCTVNILLGRCQYSCFAAPASSDSLISCPTAVDYSRAVCFLRLVTEACRPMQWTPTRRIHGCYTSHERVPATPPLLETNGGPVSLDESDHIAPCVLLHNNQAAHSCSDFALQLSSGQTFEKLALGPGCTTSETYKSLSPNSSSVRFAFSADLLSSRIDLFRRRTVIGE
jgi:hypothetical protein